MRSKFFLYGIVCCLAVSSVQAEARRVQKRVKKSTATVVPPGTSTTTATSASSSYTAACAQPILGGGGCGAATMSEYPIRNPEACMDPGSNPYAEDPAIQAAGCGDLAVQDKVLHMQGYSLGSHTVTDSNCTLSGNAPMPGNDWTDRNSAHCVSGAVTDPSQAGVTTIASPVGSLNCPIAGTKDMHYQFVSQFDSLADWGGTNPQPSGDITVRTSRPPHSNVSTRFQLAGEVDEFCTSTWDGNLYSYAKIFADTPGNFVPSANLQIAYEYDPYDYNPIYFDEDDEDLVFLGQNKWGGGTWVNLRVNDPPLAGDFPWCPDAITGNQSAKPMITMGILKFKTAIGCSQNLGTGQVTCPDVDSGDNTGDMAILTNFGVGWYNNTGQYMTPPKYPADILAEYDPSHSLRVASPPVYCSWTDNQGQLSHYLTNLIEVTGKVF